VRKHKTKLESLTSAQIENITEAANHKKNVPLVASQQVNMRLDAGTLDKVKKLATAQNIPYTTFLARLLKEDIDRLWGVFKKVS
jgi:predicted DNA binding CopG/RHH family protein